MATPLAQISASRRRRQPHRRQGERSPKRSMSMPTEIDRLIAAEADADGRTYAAVVAERLRESYERDAEPIAD
jgi:hypothetical protein